MTPFLEPSPRRRHRASTLKIHPHRCRCLFFLLTTWALFYIFKPSGHLQQDFLQHRDTRWRAHSPRRLRLQCRICLRLRCAHSRLRLRSTSLVIFGLHQTLWGLIGLSVFVVFITSVGSVFASVGFLSSLNGTACPSPRCRNTPVILLSFLYAAGFLALHSFGAFLAGCVSSASSASASSATDSTGTVTSTSVANATCSEPHRVVAAFLYAAAAALSPHTSAAFLFAAAIRQSLYQSPK